MAEVSLDQPAPPEAARSRGGRRGGRLKAQIVENKKDEMQDYLQRAGALIQSYVPPDPTRIQAAQDARRVTATPQDGGRMRVAIAEYLQPGGALTVDLDTAAGRLVGLGVTTYLDQPEEAVTLAVQWSALPDGAAYAAETTLEAKAKNLTVVIRNSGHKPMAR